MDIQRLKTMPSADRKLTLQNEALEITEGLYTRELSPEELTVWKDKLSETSVKQATILEEFDQVKEDFKARLDPLKSELKAAITAVKYRAVQESGRLYKMPDHDEQMIYVLDESGSVVSSRKMLPEERQFRISMRDAI